MITGYFIRGLLIGLIFGVPAGAIGALTIQRTLEKGFFAGFVTGTGSSAADLIYSCAGVFGITIIADFLSAHQVVIRVIGGFVILLLGAVILRKTELPSVQPDTKGTPIFFFMSAFMAAIFNPATILSFMAAFTAFGIHGDLDAYQGTALILGVFAGTLCWWAALSGVVAHFRKRVTNNVYKWLNRILGCFMTLFGIIMMLQGLIISS